MGSLEDPFKINNPAISDEQSRKERHMAVHADGRSVDVALEFESDSKIAKGCFGEIHRVRAEVINEEKERDAKSFVVKKFYRDGEQQAQETLEKHKELKRIGVATWHTMRLLKDEGAILMTDGEKDGSLVISSNANSRSIDFFETSKLDRLEGFEDFVRTALENLDLANQNNYFIPPDAWFACILVQNSSSETGQDEIVGSCKRIFIGDFDFVWEYDFKKNGENGLYRREKQINFLEQFIEVSVIEKILSVDAKRKYWDILDQIVEDWKEAKIEQNG